MRLEKKAVLIQSWLRMQVDRSRFSACQLIVFNIQQCYRSKKARSILRQRKLEAKDVSRISEERDKLKEQIAAMMAREEASKQLLNETKTLTQKTQKDELERLSKESKRKDEEIMQLKNASIKAKEEAQKLSMKQSEISTHSSTNSIHIQNNELEKLRIESKRKDSVILEMKNKIEELQEIIRRNTNYPVSATRVGPDLSESVGSVSLLDFEENLKTPNTKSTVLNELNESWSQESKTLRPKTLNFDTPIHVAIRAADDDALSVAVTNCEDIAFDINRGGRDGKSPLHLAVLNSNIVSANFLLQNQSVANTQDYDGNTPLHYAESGAMVKVLLDVGKANPNIPNESGICAIHIAVRRRDVQSVKLLIENRANVNVADDTKWMTPLHLISQPINFGRSGQSGLDLNSSATEIAKILLAAKVPFPADVDYQDKDGNTPLHHASVLSSRYAGDLISLFLKNKASPNIQNNRGQTPLHLVLHNMNLRKFDFFDDLVQLIIYHGSATDIHALSGCTPLHLALYHQDTKNAIQLVENGAQLHHPWVKPARWQAHWAECCTGNQVYSLEMIDDDEIRLSLVSSIKSKQNIAPPRSNCMHCKKKISAFNRAKNCQHCGSLVCSQCAPNNLDKSFFPSYCEIKEDEGKVCLICETLLISRKRDANIMGREVYAIHGRQEDVSFLDMDATHQGETITQQLQVEM
jgi:ankyrin repeat protein